MNDRSTYTLRIPSSMLAVVICYAPFKREFERKLESSGFSAFTLVPRVLGKGGSSNPVMDNDVWPGFSVLYLIQFGEESYGEFRNLVKEFSDKVKPFKVFIFRGVEVW